MAELNTYDILKDNNTHNPNSITSLSLKHKSLSYISCLNEFNNLERLNLDSNCLTSLKGLESCFNLKWLSVQLNKLQSLKGIEGLINLNVLNAGKNKLKSMDEIKNLVNLRALILNDNEIVSISGLDQLAGLNTLVLSRNPICKVGNALAKLKSITKVSSLIDADTAQSNIITEHPITQVVPTTHHGGFQISLSNCKLEDIDSSIKACTGLEELRLAHNDIKTLPAQLAYAKKLHILDLGSNMISRWSDLEVLSSLHNLRNINLLGNPIAEKAKLIKKVQKLVPSLQILNSKRMDKLRSAKDQMAEDAVLRVGEELTPSKKKKADHDINRDANRNNSKDADSDELVDQKGLNDDHKLAKDRELGENTYCKGKEKSGRKSKVVEHNANVIDEKEYQPGDKSDHMKLGKTSRKAKLNQANEGEPGRAHNDGGNEQKKRKKMEKHLEKEVLLQEADKGLKYKSSERKGEKARLDVIDDNEVPFAELLAYDANQSMEPNDGQRRDIQPVGKFDASAVVTYPAKKKKSKYQGAGASELQFLMPEVGLGGQSAWTDDEQ